MPVTSQNLTSTAVRGVQWTTAATVLTAGLQIGYTAVMARLLDPAAFGLVAMAGVVLRFGSYLAEMGLGHALVQRPNIDGNDVRAAFTASLGLGLAVAALAWLAAPLAVLFLENDAVVPLLRVQALGFVLVGLGATATSLLRCDMRFPVVAKVEVAAYVLGYGGVGIGLARWGAGVWSLIAASLVQQFFAAFNSGVARHSLRLIFERAPYGRLLGYGSRVSVVGFLEFINQPRHDADCAPAGLGAAGHLQPCLHAAVLAHVFPDQQLGAGGLSGVQQDSGRPAAGTGLVPDQQHLGGYDGAAGVRRPGRGRPRAGADAAGAALGRVGANSARAVPVNSPEHDHLICRRGGRRPRQPAAESHPQPGVYGPAGGALLAAEGLRAGGHCRGHWHGRGGAHLPLHAHHPPRYRHSLPAAAGHLPAGPAERRRGAGPAGRGRRGAPLHAPALLTLLALMAAGAGVLGAVVLSWPSAELRPVLRGALARLRELSALPDLAHLGLARYDAFLERRSGGLPAPEFFTNQLMP